MKQMKRKKRKNRPTISQQKQMTILKEQNYNCRGLGKMIVDFMNVI